MKLKTFCTTFYFYDSNNIAVSHEMFSQYSEYTTLGLIVGNKLVDVKNQQYSSTDINKMSNYISTLLNNRNKLKDFCFVKTMFTNKYRHGLFQVPRYVNKTVNGLMSKKQNETQHIFKLKNKRNIDAYLFFICGGRNPFYINLDVLSLKDVIDFETDYKIESYPIFRKSY